jgi:hypothetical protein
MKQAGNPTIAVESSCTSDRRLDRGALMRWIDEGGAFRGQPRRNAIQAPGATVRYTARRGARLGAKNCAWHTSAHL